MTMVNIPIDTPEDFVPIGSGKYILRIDEAPTLEPTQSGEGENLIINFIISSGVDGAESPFDGRKIRDYIFQNEMGHTRTLQCCTCFGVELHLSEDGKHKVFDRGEFVGKVGNATIKPNTYKDKESGEMKSNSKVGDYLAPSAG